jgi:hypothetical protein
MSNTVKAQIAKYDFRNPEIARSILWKYMLEIEILTMSHLR